MKTLTIFKLEQTKPNTSHHSGFFFPIRKARSAVTEILTCVGNVRRENVFLASLSKFPHLSTFATDLSFKYYPRRSGSQSAFHYAKPTGKSSVGIPEKNGTAFSDQKHTFSTKTHLQRGRNKHQEDWTNEKIE